MYEISCEMCLDLMPMVQDGIASEDSRKAVERHLENCSHCCELCETEIPMVNKTEALSKAVKRVQTVSAVIIGILVLMGIILCESVMQGSSMLFVLVALVIRCLLQVTFRKEKGKVVRKTIALLAAVALTWGIVWAGGEIFGNPVTKVQAEHHIRGYLEGAFADTDYYLESVRYDWSKSYHGDIRSVSDPELEFYIAYRNGEIIYDTYKEHVLNIWE